ncbi:MAG: helix-turn-helix transcriptional regulator [Alphaproteobacteria bacterium]|nr:helix-turn-helix transcriptional regulator [Alphaproteobacteria bacterium]
MDTVAEKISSTLKQLRSQRGWSLDISSQKTGVSKAMLGQIERGESSPTIATLWKIASGFDVSFSSFVEDAQSNQADLIHRKQDLKQMHKHDDKIRVMPIFTYDKRLDFEVFIIELLPGCEHLSPPHQPGVVEHVIVASGEIEVLINNAWHPVKQNEGLRFCADAPHGYRNTSSLPAVFHDMIHYKRVDVS